MKFRPLRLAALLALCASVLTAPHLSAQDDAPLAERDGPGGSDWYFEQSDLPVDPGFTFGKLDNGMRYVLRQNATPEGTAVVRMRIGSGSLDETEAERGLSHYLEHMAFNGSANIPEGEMVKLLEREGLAFGADTNASTGFDAITYKLNLPRNDTGLLDTALMLMRETASELTLAEDAVERERGVVLAERRDRRNFAQRAREDGLEFLAPGARFVDRMPIGTRETLETATAQQLRGLYERTYTPANTVLVVVGDFPVEAMESAIREHFSDWNAALAPVEPETGPVDITRGPGTDIHIDPALSESVTITMLGPWIDRPDSRAARAQALQRSIAYRIIGRRLSRLQRSEDAPFRRARYGASDIFEDARSDTISVSSEDGEWRKGVLAAVRAVNRAITHGFTQAEVDEQLANIRTALENRVAGADTRSNQYFAGAALALEAREVVPVTPQFALAEFERNAAAITPEVVHAALRENALPLDRPLIRFQGRTAPEGGEEALAEAFAQAMALPIAPPQDKGANEFAYQDFGAPGEIVSDVEEERLGLRLVTFANGVRATLKQTDIRKDRVSFRIQVDGGRLLNTREDPLATYLVGSLPSGGLGRHSQDELQSVLAGRSVSLRMSNALDAFSFSGGTTQRDLALQLQLVTAALTDPGYRPEGIDQFRRGIDNFFKSLGSTPASAYGAAQGAILSDGDPRFSLQEREAFYALDYAQLQDVIGDRLASGAIEVALVGDFDEEAAIAALATTLGALPAREVDFLARESARIRAFTSQRGTRTIRHSGESDQAWVRMVWPTRDDSDLAEVIELSLLSRVIRLELTERLREDLGKAYSTQASNSSSSIYPGYGTFTISAPVATSEVENVRAVFRELLADMRAGRIDADLVDRARQPMLEAYDNALKTLGGWMSLAARAQSQPERIDRWFAGPDLLRAVEPADLQQAAQRYLDPAQAVEFLVLPETGEAGHAGGAQAGVTVPPAAQ